MTIEIKVPVLPESVADALLLDWSKQPGDRVYRDEILVEVETDKVVLEVPAPADGILSEIVEQTGATVLGEQLLARIETGSDVDDLAALTDMAEQALTDIDAATADTPVSDSPPQGGSENESLPSDDDQKLSPAVRRLIDENGLDPARINGSGRGGRIIKEDVLNYMATVDSSVSDQGSATAAAGDASPGKPSELIAAPAMTASPVPDSAGGLRQQSRAPMSRLRQTIASRLLHSQQSAALLTTFNEVNMQAVMELRSKYKEAFEEKHGARLGFMSFFVKASVAGLQNFLWSIPI